MVFGKDGLRGLFLSPRKNVYCYFFIFCGVCYHIGLCKDISRDL